VKYGPGKIRDLPPALQTEPTSKSDEELTAKPSAFESHVFETTKPSQA
jgi:hypothetical protein